MRITLIGLMLCCLGACGWHLRGQLTAPPDIDSLYIASAARHTELLEQIRRQLDSQDIRATSEPLAGVYSLSLGNEQIRRRTVGVGSDALAAAYEITMSVEYQIFDAGGIMLSEPLRASISRSYNYIDNDPSAAAQEERLLADEMRADLAQQLLRRVYTLIDRHQRRDGQTAP